MKKILHVINSVETVGGAEKIVSELCDRDNLNQHHFVNLYPKPSKISVLEKIWYLLLFVLKIINLRSKFDVFHFHLFPSLYLSLFFPKGKCVIHEHNTSNRRRDISFFKPIERLIYSRVKRVICISDATDKSLNDWCGPLENTVVVSNFSRFDYVNIPNDISSERSLVMVASFTDQKNHTLVVNAMKYLDEDVVLYFLGDGPKRETVERFVYENNLTHRVNFEGNVKNVSHYFSKCNLALLLSFWEGFGMVVVEAASLNRPTLCSNVSGLNNVVLRDDLLFDNDRGGEELAKKITTTLEKIRKDSNYFDSYCSQLSNTYSFSKFVNSLDDIYKGI